MKYICKVSRSKSTVHVVKTSIGNVEVEYDGYYRFKEVRVDPDFNIYASDVAFTTIVLAVELVKFIMENEE